MAISSLRARRGLLLSAFLLWACSAWACGGKVIIDGDFLTAGGDGGGDGASGSSSSGGVTSSSSSGSTSNCTEGTCIGSGTNDCGCVRTCGTAVLQTKCALNDSKKLQCICSYDDVFSGACFETDVSLSCDMDKGCCAKYFKGI